MQRATKESKRVIFGTLAFIVLMAVGVSSALADSATYTLGDAEATYGLHSDTGPYATVTISLTGTTAVVTFNSLSNGGYTYLFYDGGAAVLNVQGSFNVTGLGYVTSPGFDNPGALTCQSPLGWISTGLGTNTGSASTNVGGCNYNTGNEDALGSFDLAVYDATNAGTTHGGPGNENYGLSQITVTLSGTWASASQVLTPTTEGYLAAAHIEACSNSGGCSPANTDQSTNQGYASTTEPGTPTLLLSGLFGLGLVGLGRRLLG